MEQSPGSSAGLVRAFEDHHSKPHMNNADELEYSSSKIYSDNYSEYLTKEPDYSNSTLNLERTARAHISGSIISKAPTSFLVNASAQRELLPSTDTAKNLHSFWYSLKRNSSVHSARLTTLSSVTPNLQEEKFARVNLKLAGVSKHYLHRRNVSDYAQLDHIFFNIISNSNSDGNKALLILLESMSALDAHQIARQQSDHGKTIHETDYMDDRYLRLKRGADNAFGSTSSDLTDMLHGETVTNIEKEHSQISSAQKWTEETVTHRGMESRPTHTMAEADVTSVRSGDYILQLAQYSKNGVNICSLLVPYTYTYS